MNIQGITILLAILVTVITIGITYFSLENNIAKQDQAEEILAKELPGTSISLTGNYHPKATVMLGADESSLRIPLTKLVDYSLGKAAIRDSNDHITKIEDKNNLMLTVYKNNLGNTTIVAKITNTGSQKVTISYMIISGAIVDHGFEKYVLQSEVVSCSGSYIYHDKLHPDMIFTVTCPYPGAISGPVSLDPGKSLTAYLQGNFVENNVKVNGYGIGVVYGVGSSGPPFDMNTPLQILNN